MDEKDLQKSHDESMKARKATQVQPNTTAVYGDPVKAEPEKQDETPKEEKNG